MEIGPICRALARNKLGAALVALQIAFTMTVIINAIFIINERNTLMGKASGMDDANLFHVTIVGVGDDYNEEVVTADDLALLRGMPDIIDASVINAIPVSGGGSSTGVRVVEGEDTPSTGAAFYRSDPHVIASLGLDLIAGENFVPSDQRYAYEGGPPLTDKTIISRALAEQMWPDLTVNDVVGQTLFVGGTTPMQVIGIVETLQAPWPTMTLVERSLITTEQSIDNFSRYMVRTEPGARDRVMGQVEDLLVEAYPNRVIRDLRSMTETRERTFQVDNALTTILWVVVITLMVINAMGIVGLAVFSINRRRKQIGTRRALGATRPQVLRYFLLENFFISAIGVVVGALLTVALSIVLTTQFNMPVMAWYYTPLGALALILVGQLAALGPSSRATRISPATATRSV